MLKVGDEVKLTKEYRGKREPWRRHAVVVGTVKILGMFHYRISNQDGYTMPFKPSEVEPK